MSPVVFIVVLAFWAMLLLVTAISWTRFFGKEDGTALSPLATLLINFVLTGASLAAGVLLYRAI